MTKSSNGADHQISSSPVHRGPAFQLAGLKGSPLTSWRQMPRLQGACKVNDSMGQSCTDSVYYC